MKLMIDLFSTDYGLMSLIVILLILVMAVFFTRLFMGKMKNVAQTPLGDAPDWWAAALGCAKRPELLRPFSRANGQPLLSSAAAARHADCAAHPLHRRASDA